MDQTWQFAASDGLQQLYGGYPSALTVYNAGLISVQLTDDPNGTATGFPLQPGSSIVWDAGRSLNAYVPTGVAGVAQLVVLDNGGQISNPTAIAAALVNPLAAAISLTGAPPINAFTTVANGSITTTGATQASGSIDVSRYQSLDFVFQDQPAAGATPPVPRRIEFLWSDGTTDTFWMTDSAGVFAPAANGARAHGSVPVRTPSVLIRFYASARTGTTLNYTVTGSYRTVPAPIYRNGGGYFGQGVGTTVSGVDGDRFAGVDFGTPGAGLIRTEWPHIAAGLATFSYRVVLAAGGIALTLFVNDLVSGDQLFSFTCPANAISQGVAQILIPNRPISVVANVGAAVVVSSCIVALAYQG